MRPLPCRYACGWCGTSHPRRTQYRTYGVALLACTVVPSAANALKLWGPSTNAFTMASQCWSCACLVPAFTRYRLPITYRSACAALAGAAGAAGAATWASWAPSVAGAVGAAGAAAALRCFAMFAAPWLYAPLLAHPYTCTCRAKYRLTLHPGARPGAPGAALNPCGRGYSTRPGTYPHAPGCAPRCAPTGWHIVCLWCCFTAHSCAICGTAKSRHLSKGRATSTVRANAWSGLVRACKQRSCHKHSSCQRATKQRSCQRGGQAKVVPSAGASKVRTISKVYAIGGASKVRASRGRKQGPCHKQGSCQPRSAPSWCSRLRRQSAGGVPC